MGFNYFQLHKGAVQELVHYYFHLKSADFIKVLLSGFWCQGSSLAGKNWFLRCAKPAKKRLNAKLIWTSVQYLGAGKVRVFIKYFFYKGVHLISVLLVLVLCCAIKSVVLVNQKSVL